MEIPAPGSVPTGTTEPTWTTPAECYLAALAPPAPDWSIGSFETGTVELDTAGIMAAVADALLAVGSASPAYEGSGLFWFWPPVAPEAKQVRVTVSTLWEAAWALIDIPGR